MKVTVLTDKDTQQDNKNKEENSMGGSDSTETNVDDIIDQALGTTPTAEVQDSTTPVEDQTQESTTETADGSTEAGQATDESGQTPADTTDGQTSTEEEPKNDEKDAKITQLEQELADAKAKIEELETEAIDAQSQIETLTKTAEDARTEANNFKQRCVALATANKEAIVDSIVAKEVFENDDAKEERKKDLMVKSMKELKTIKSSVQQSNVQRTQASITSPCLATEGPTDNATDSATDINKTTKDNHDIKTVDDAAQEVIKRLFK
jgi:chromosome segregation ATPase